MAVHNRLSSIIGGHPLSLGLPLRNLRAFSQRSARKPAAELPMVEMTDREYAQHADRPLYSEHTPGRTWLMAAKHGALRR